MRSKRLKLLKELINIPSPSGYEGNIAEFIRKKLLNYLPKTRVKVDENKNVIAIIKGQTDKVVMIDAHSDTVGFILSNVDRSGLISLQYIGGGCKQILSARHLQILSDKGKVNAVVNRKHSHLIDDEDDEKIDKIHEAQVDVGARNRKDILRKMKIGDPVVYKPYFEELLEDKKLGKFISGYGLDNKSGVLILIESIKEIVKSKKKPIPTLVFTFTAQEETGKSKVRQLIKKYKPDLFIECDVTFATDYGENLEREVGRCELGKGIVLYRGVGIDRGTLRLLENIARHNKVKFQHQASTGDLGYNSDVALDYVSKACIVGIPLRNMHNVVEIVNAKDLNYGIRLISKFLVSKEIKRIF